MNATCEYCLIIPGLIIGFREFNIIICVDEGKTFTVPIICDKCNICIGRWEIHEIDSGCLNKAVLNMECWPIIPNLLLTNLNAIRSVFSRNFIIWNRTSVGKFSMTYRRLSFSLLSDPDCMK